MIEILKNGPEKFIKYCPHCGSKLQYELSDVSRVFGTDVFILTCPVCNYKIKHEINDNDFIEEE